MAELEAITRKWGNSLGIALPKIIVEKEHLHENQKVMIDVKAVADIKKLRGLVHFKKSAQEIKDEMKRGWE